VSRRAASCQLASRWLGAQKPGSPSYAGRQLFPAFTGYDSVAFDAWVHLVECWGRRDQHSEGRLLDAMAALLDSVQLSVRPAFWAVVPAILDWSDVDRIRQRVALRELQAGGQ